MTLEKLVSPPKFKIERGLVLGFTAAASVLWLSSLFPEHALGTCLQGPVSAGTGWINWFDRTTLVLFGWGGLLFGQVGWFANLTFLVLAVKILADRSVARQLIFFHGCLAGWALLPIPLAHNEGYSEPMCLGSYDLGFWLWLAAQAWMLVAAFLHVRQRPTARDKLSS
jgi:hypothetical protein